jgi:predicted membrane protein
MLSVIPPETESGPRAWQTRLPTFAFAGAILIPLFLYGVAGLSSLHRNTLGLGGILTAFAISILGAVLTFVASVAGVYYNRRSNLAWVAAVLCLIEVSVAIFIALSFRNFRF